MFIVRKPDIHVSILALTENSTEILNIRPDPQTIETSRFHFDRFFFENVYFSHETFLSVSYRNTDSFSQVELPQAEGKYDRKGVLAIYRNGNRIHLIIEIRVLSRIAVPIKSNGNLPLTASFLLTLHIMKRFGDLRIGVALDSISHLVKCVRPGRGSHEQDKPEISLVFFASSLD